MDGWIDRHRWMDGQTDMDGWMDGQIDKTEQQTDGQTDQIDRYKDRGMDGYRVRQTDTGGWIHG